jgi:DNA polymerase-3 subunit gamma/tau
MDVIEIDAASNTGVDNIRELIERAQFAPVQCRYKVYCLDEVHMLSTAAFNALLKTLEEPPAQVVFILATTDPQRVLATIISRCQRFDFRRIALSAMVDHLTQIAAQEQIPITSAAVELVAQMAQGGLRDAESLLDQLSLHPGEITTAQIWDLVGAVPEQDLMALVKAIATHQPVVMLERTQHLLDRGREPLVVLQNLASFYRDLLIAKTAPDRRDLVAITETTWTELCDFAQQMEMATILAGQQHLRSSEQQVKQTTQPRLWLEVALFGLLPQGSASPSASAAEDPVPRPQAVASSPNPVQDVGAGASTPVPSLDGVPAPQQPVISDLAIASAPAPVEVSNSPHKGDLRPASPPPLPAPAVPAEPATPPDLEQIWQQVLAHLNLPSRALLKEHGQLLHWQGVDLRIGMPKNLIRIAEGRLPEVEATVLKLFNRKVKISLEVAATVSAVVKASRQAHGSEAAQRGTGEIETGRKLIPSRSPSAEQQAAPSSTEALPQPSPAPAPSFADQTSSMPQPSTPPSVQANGIQPEAQGQSWQTEDEFLRVARSFAQFFNGSLVEADPGDTE